MSFLHPKNLEELVINLLKSEGVSTHELLERVRKERKNTTKQGFYAALRKLKFEDCVVVYQKKVALNTTWIQKLRNEVQAMTGAYIRSGEAMDILSLADKESISYSFSTIHQLDAFWGHAQNIVVHATPPSDAVYSYDPHYWFYIGRKNTERALIAEIVSLGKQFLMTVGGTAALDKTLLPDFADNMRQYHMENLFDKQTRYIVVIGDYIFEVSLDSATAQNIENIYRHYESLTNEAIDKLQQISKTRARTKLKISKNRTRAHKLKTKLGKSFFIKKP